MTVSSITISSYFPKQAVLRVFQLWFGNGSFDKISQNFIM